MTTTRGFVDLVEVGRGGLVRVRLVTASGAMDFTIADLDSDPERFNERLTKVSLARDAMNRAEPVEIEWTEGKSGRAIDRIARISRDRLDSPGSVDVIGGLVLGLVLSARNAIQGAGESPDEALVYVVTTAGSAEVLHLDMQTPERGVAVAQYDAVRAAQAAGQSVRFLVSTDETGNRQVMAVWVGAGPGRDGDGTTQGTVSGFVESLGVILPAGTDPLAGTLAVARVTTAPEFTGDGGTVSVAPFDPATRDFFVARGSVPYELLEAGLRDNVRVRVQFQQLAAETGAKPDVRARSAATAGAPKAGAATAGAATTGDEGEVRFRAADMESALRQQYGSSTDAGGPAGDGTALVTGVELLAPLASASRPVWLHVDRHLLDVGPDAAECCADGLPTSSLTPRGLRDMRIPYRAEWKGCGCFNAGVYRFEITAPAGCTVDVDGKELCLYPSGTDGVQVGYACADGHCCVTVVIPEYVCDTDFDLDVYRIR